MGMKKGCVEGKEVSHPSALELASINNRQLLLVNGHSRGRGETGRGKCGGGGDQVGGGRDVWREGGQVGQGGGEVKVGGGQGGGVQVDEHHRGKGGWQGGQEGGQLKGHDMGDGKGRVRG